VAKWRLSINEAVGGMSAKTGENEKAKRKKREMAQRMRK